MKIVLNSFKIRSARAFCELKYTVINGLGLIIRLAPAKLFSLELLSFCSGLWILCRQTARERKFIVGFAKIAGNKVPSWLYILKYCVQAGRNRIWNETLFFEVQHGLKKYFTFEGREGLEESLKRRGAVLLGAHYGPRLHLFLFHQMKLEVRHLVERAFYDQQQNLVQSAGRCSLSKKARFFKEFRHCLVVKGSERELVGHLKKGGAVSMFIDFPNRNAESSVTDFFGFPMRFHKFPFRLALEYEVPVFFYFLTRTRMGGYQLSFVPSGTFSTPDEGIAKYASFFQSKIMASPSLWNNLPGLLKWFPNPSVIYNVTEQ